MDLESLTPAAVPFRSRGAERNGFAPRPGFLPFHLEDAESAIPERFRSTVARHRSSPALRDGGAALSYGELYSRASGIAGAIDSQLGATPGPVAVALPYGAAFVEAILGVLLAGRAYLPLDPGSPDTHLRGIFDAAHAAGAVVREADRARFEGLCGARLIDVERRRATAGSAARPAGAPEDVAALFATSGSTGKPKIVPLSHRAILFDTGRQVNDLLLGPDDRFDHLFSFAFSASLAPLFGALLNGAELRLRDLSRGITDLLEWLAENRISVSTMSVSTLRTLCAVLRPWPGVSAPRLVSVGGEPLLDADVQSFRDIFPNSCVLQNAMAATETRTYAQYFVHSGETISGAAPIGWPVFGKEALIEAEEVVIRSRYIANGYWRESEAPGRFQREADGATVYATGDRVERRSDGCLTFLGRADSLVKLRGYRIDLEGIEAAIRRHPAVRECAVVVRSSRLSGDELLAAFTSSAELTNPETLRAFLVRQLPAQMVPASLIRLEALPRTPTGKIDRGALRHLAAREAAAPAEDGALGEMVELWASALNRSRVGPFDRFDEIGGDSLRGARLLLAVEARFACRLPADALMRCPTPALLAALVEKSRDPGSGVVQLEAFQESGEGVLVLLPGIGGECRGLLKVARAVAGERRAYGFGWRFREGEPSRPVEWLAEAAIERVEALVSGGQRLVVCGYSFGGTLAFEIARQWRARTGSCPGVVLLDMPAVNGPRWRKRGSVRAGIDVLRNLPAWLPYQARTRTLRDLAVRARAHLGRAIGGRRSEFSPGAYFGAGRPHPTVEETARLSYQALQSYTPREYEGRVVLLRCVIPGLWRDHDRSMGWDAIVKRGLEVRDLPGDHGTCLNDANLRVTAPVLRAAIDAADRAV